eukprot:GSMAST32.ASY1.ANO1.2472.1 assembled CDS
MNRVYPQKLISFEEAKVADAEYLQKHNHFGHVVFVKEEYPDCYESKTKSPYCNRYNILGLLTSNTGEAFMMALTLFALYGSDINQLHSGPEGDIVFGWFTFSVMLIFFAECAIFSMWKPKYIWGYYFWLDIVAALSLLGDIPFVVEGILGNSFAAARTGRASRAGTRAARIIRVIRLLRLTRLTRLVKITKKNTGGGEKDEECKNGEISANDVIDRLSEYTTAKVIVGLLLMLLSQSFTNNTPEDLTYYDGLQILKGNLLTLFEQNSKYKSCDATFGLEESHSLIPNEYSSYMKLHENTDCQNLIKPCSNADEYNCGKSAYECLSEMSDVKTAKQVLGRSCTSPSLVDQTLRKFTEIYSCYEDDCNKTFGEGNILYLRYFNVTYVTTVNSLEVIPKWDRIKKLRNNEVEKFTISEQFEEQSCEKLSFCMILDRKWLRDAESYESIYQTSLIVALLVLGMISFNAESARLGNHIMKPIQELCLEMAQISKLTFTKRKLAPSSVYEVKQCQAAYLKMKVGLCGFVKYAPRKIVQNMLNSGEVASLYVKMREVSILFSHITEFEHLCKTEGPQQLLSILSFYFDAVSESVGACDGTLLDFIGDMVLAIWNAPSLKENHARWCIDAASRVYRFMNSELCRKMSTTQFPDFNMNAGINTANVFVGNTGAHARMKYSVLGDGVNLASRVGELNGLYKTTIICSEQTSNEPTVKNTFLLRNIDCVTVKGKSVGVKVYDVFSARNRAPKRKTLICETHDDAMKLYFERRFKEAVQRFDDVLSLKPGDRAATILQERCRTFMNSPPPKEWDGANILKAKHF